MNMSMFFQLGRLIELKKRYLENIGQNALNGFMSMTVRIIELINN